MDTVIVTTSPVFATVGKVLQFIADNDWSLIRCAESRLPNARVDNYLDRMTFLVAGETPVTAGIINNAPKLRGILRHGALTENIDVAAATARKIPVLHAPGASANAAAEMALGGILSLARRIPMAHARLMAGVWEHSADMEIAGKTLGIIGFGNTGRKLAEKAAALSMRVLASDLYPDRRAAPEGSVEFTSLPDLLRRSDFVSLHIYGGIENTRLLDAQMLALMKPTAFLLHYAKGETVDLDALAIALQRNELMGAVIDSYAVEPPDLSHPIFASPKALFTPHAREDTVEAMENTGMMNVTDMKSILQGQRPGRVINPEIYD